MRQQPSFVSESATRSSDAPHTFFRERAIAYLAIASQFFNHLFDGFDFSQASHAMWHRRRTARIKALRMLNYVGDVVGQPVDGKSEPFKDFFWISF